MELEYAFLEIKTRKVREMPRKKELPKSREIPLLCQEKIRGLDEISQKKHFWDKRRARRIFALTIFVTLTFTIVIFFVGVFLSDDIESVLRSFGDVFLEYIDTVWAPQDSDTGGESEPPESDSVESETESETLTTETSPPESEPIENTPSDNGELTLEALYSFDYSAVPDGQKAVIPMDLSMYSNGVGYINNSTGYSVNTELLLSRNLGSNTKFEQLSSVREPVVLIIHTHGTEAFMEDGSVSYIDNGGEIARSTQKNETVVALGETIANVLNDNGINALHVAFMHDSVGYRNSYERAADTIKQYLEIYPSIELVIDVHRDGIMRSTGELIRPVTLVDGEAAAQVMCVVGSDWGGGDCPNWQENLSLALKLRESLNSEYLNLCRPTDLRPSSYNQEFSRYAMLLEIGSAGNSLKEAEITAKIIAEHLARIMKKTENVPK